MSSAGQCYGNVSPSPSCWNPKRSYRSMMPKQLPVFVAEISSIKKLGWSVILTKPNSGDLHDLLICVNKPT